MILSKWVRATDSSGERLHFQCTLSHSDLGQSVSVHMAFSHARTPYRQPPRSLLLCIHPVFDCQYKRKLCDSLLANPTTK